MFENFKHYFTLTLVTFMGPAHRGEESPAEMVRRQRDERRNGKAAPTSSPSPAELDAGHAQLEYMH